MPSARSATPPPPRSRSRSRPPTPRPAHASCWPRSARASPGAPPRSPGEAPMREGCALVTGASRGIGAAVAKALAEDGWAVGLNYRSDEDGAKRIAQEIEWHGGRAMPIAADIAEADAAEPLFQAVEER